MEGKDDGIDGWIDGKKGERKEGRKERREGGKKDKRKEGENTINSSLLWI